MGMRRADHVAWVQIEARPRRASAREKKGTNPGPPDRTGRTRRTASVLRTPPPVLNSTAANCGPPFGTKRPQVQILSPRPYFRWSEARTESGEGSDQSVQQQIARNTAATTTFGPSASARLFANHENYVWATNTEPHGLWLKTMMLDLLEQPSAHLRRCSQVSLLSPVRADQRGLSSSCAATAASTRLRSAVKLGSCSCAVAWTTSKSMAQ